MSDKTVREIALEQEIELLKKKRDDSRKQAEATEHELIDKKRELREEWNRKSQLEIDKLEKALELRYGVARTNAKFKKIFQIAWDRGHSEGLHSVSNCFDEMADLLK